MHWPERVAEAARPSRSVTAAGLIEAFANIAVPLLYGWFAYVHVHGFLLRPRPSMVLAIAFETLFAISYVMRRAAAEASRSSWDWATALAGTFLPLLLRPVAGARDSAVGELFQMLGGAVSFWGICSLSRSIGIVPANRGIRSTGPYRWVRHPLYCGYTLGHLGYLMNNPSVPNAALAIAALSFQLIRIRNEERLLSASPEYCAYRARTRWRLLPFVY